MASLHKSVEQQLVASTHAALLMQFRVMRSARYDGKASVSSSHSSLSCLVWAINPYDVEEQLTARDNIGTTVPASGACHDCFAVVWVGVKATVASQPICYTEIQNTVTHIC